jgi:hypothetical protein
VTTNANRAATLDRAYVQSRVIETSLERLSATASQVEPELREQLSSCVSTFDEYVRRLEHAKMLCDAAHS